MKVKTSELSGMMLCYAVCMIEMPHLVWNKTIGIHHASDQIIVPELPEPKCYSPFTGWAMFGPIIERERMLIRPCAESCGGQWAAKPWDETVEYTFGYTPLIAAMRCLVNSKLGDEVDVPEELL